MTQIGKIYKIQYLETGNDCWGRVEYDWFDYYKEDFFESEKLAMEQIEHIKKNDKYKGDRDFRCVEVKLWS